MKSDLSPEAEASLQRRLQKQRREIHEKRMKEDPAYREFVEAVLRARRERIEQESAAEAASSRRRFLVIITVAALLTVTAMLIAAALMADASYIERALPYI